MKVKDLIKGLKAADPESNVCIRVQRSGPAIGPLHTVGISGSCGGIDWDSGREFLQTDEVIYAGLDKLKSAADFARHVRESMYMHSRDKSNRRCANVVSAIKRHLDIWLPDRSDKEE